MATCLTVLNELFQPLVMTGAGALPLPTKHPPKLNPATTKTIANAIFFMELPLLLRSLAASHVGSRD